MAQYNQGKKILQQSKSRIVIRLAAISIVALSVFWAVQAQRNKEVHTQIASAFEPCINRNQDPSLIIDVCTRIIDEGVKSSELLATLYTRRGYALDRIDRWDEAITDFDRAIALNPKDFEAWQGKSFALDGLDEDLAALEAIETSLAIEPAKKYSVRRKFRILTKLERYDEADDYYTQLMMQYPVSEYPKNYWMPQQLGRLRLALEQPEAAAEVLTLAVLSNPSDQKSRNLFFRACLELGPYCPRLMPASEAASEEQDCDAIASQVAEEFPKFWATLHPDTKENDANLEKQANMARMQIVENAYMSFSMGLQLGETGETPEANYLLFEGLVSCVETGDLFNPIENAGLSEEFKTFHGGIVRTNMVDLAHYMLSKAK